MAYVADKAYYHDGDGRLYEHAAPGRELLVRKGGELRDADAARFGLIEPPKRGKASKAAPAPAAAAAPQKEGS
jgi:hypothetical protein